MLGFSKLWRILYWSDCYTIDRKISVVATEAHGNILSNHSQFLLHFGVWNIVRKLYSNH